MKALLKITFTFISIAVLLVLSLSSYEQSPALKVYHISDGLPSNEIGGTYQDKYGYLWVYSSAGLSRFDGRQFVNYSLTDGLPSLEISSVFQDSNGRLWIGTTSGMAQFENNRFVTFSTSDNLTIFYVFNFIETKDKQVWALTDKGAYAFNGNNWKKIILYPGFEKSPCRSIIEVRGELYVNYPTDIVYRNKEGKWRKIASLRDGTIFNFMSLQDNQILVSAFRNIYTVCNHQLTPLYKKKLLIKNYFSYYVDSKRRLWLSGKNFLKITKPGDWQHFSTSLINQHRYFYTTCEDSNHNIWMGTKEGLLKLKDIAFTILDKNNAAPLDGIYNIISLPGNRLILSSGTKTGLIIYDSNACKQIMPPRARGNEHYYEDPVDAYTFDRENSLWMVTRFRKFLHFNGKKLEDFSNALHLKSTELMYDIDYVKSRNQFFVCADSTLLYGNSGKLSTFIPRNTGIPIIKPLRVLEIKNGLVLLSILGQGIYCLDTADNLIPLINKSDFAGNNKGNQFAGFFCEETNNNFWIATPGRGLYEYGFKKNELPFLKNHLSIANGLQSNDIISLTNDRQYRLWVITNAGLDILQINKAGSWEVFNYATTDELTISRFDYEKLITDKQGNVWLSSPNKILKFNAAGTRLYKQAPQIIIEKILLSFKETDWGKITNSLYSYYKLPYDPVLNYSQNSLGISFNAINLSTSNSNPEYSYKLLPLDTSWSIPAKIKSVSFAQLPPGKYQFMVRVKDEASGWSQPAVSRFIIKPPFWGKWWFRLTVLAVASYIIVSIFRARVRKIRQDALIENQLKELELKALKAQMNPHFIYNALNSIQALVANDKKAEGIHYIGSFSRLLRQVLDNSENNVVSLDKELETIAVYIQLETLRLNMQLQYKKNVPENIVTEFEKIPPLILQPFVENALWHGLSSKEGKKEITVTVSANDDWLICDITDNGIGRGKAQELKSNSALLHQSKAIDITRKRLTDFNEDKIVIPIEFFDLYDNEKKSSGTRVTVRIKRKNNLRSV